MRNAIRPIYLMVLLLLAFEGQLVFSQNQVLSPFLGTWEGSVQIQNLSKPTEIEVRIVVTGDDKATQYFKNNDQWDAVTPDRDQFYWIRDNAIYTWSSKGGIWTETQVFSLSLINPKTAELVYIRHVVNKDDGKEGDAWYLLGRGILQLRSD